MKIRPGHKYNRIERLSNLTHAQRKILGKYERYIKPEKFRAPSAFNQAMDVLRQGIQPMQPNQTEQLGQNFLQRIMNPSPEATQEFEAPYMRQFNEQIVPGLAERFTSLGAQDSSAFRQALGAAGADLMERLAALRGNLGLQGSSIGLGYSQLPMTRQGQQQQYAQNLLGSSLVPQQMQTDYDRYAQQRQLAQRGQVLGTSAFNYMNIAPQPRQPSGISGMFQGALPGLIGGAAQAGLGALIGGPAGAGLGALMGGSMGTPNRQMFAPESIF